VRPTIAATLGLLVDARATSGALLVVAALFGSAACGGGSSSTTGSGKTESARIAVSSFSRLDVEDTFDVTVSVGQKAAVTIRVDDGHQDALDVGVTDDTLHVRLEPGTSVRDATLEADVTVPTLSRIDASGASQVHLADEIAVDSLELTVSGASALDGAVKISEGRLDVSGASRTNLTGSAVRLDLSVGGASSVRSVAFTAQSLTASLSGASSAELTVTDSLSAEVSGVSALRYKGSPQITRQEISGLSSITQI
jgi:Putative auto-transporter adhesin, head GIN domain